MGPLRFLHRLAVGCLLLASCASAGLSQAAPGRLVYDRSFGNLVLQRVFVLDKAEWTVEYLYEHFGGELLPLSNRYKVVQVLFYQHENGRRDNSKPAVDTSYGLWQDLYQEFKDRLPAAGEFLSVKGNAVLRVRSLSGAVERRVLAEDDPLKIHSMSCDAEIIHFSVTPQSDGSASVHFFALSNRAGEIHCARETSAVLAEYVPASDLSLQLRSDAWFIEDAGFPIVYLFQERVTAPTLAEYRAGARSGCSLYRGKLMCR